MLQKFLFLFFASASLFSVCKSQQKRANSILNCTHSTKTGLINKNNTFDYFEFEAKDDPMFYIYRYSDGVILYSQDDSLGTNFNGFQSSYVTTHTVCGSSGVAAKSPKVIFNGSLPLGKYHMGITMYQVTSTDKRYYVNGIFQCPTLKPTTITIYPTNIPTIMEISNTTTMITTVVNANIIKKKTLDCVWIIVIVVIILN